MSYSDFDSTLSIYWFHTPLQYPVSQVRPPPQCTGKGYIQRIGKSENIEENNKCQDLWAPVTICGVEILVATYWLSLDRVDPNCLANIDLPDTSVGWSGRCVPVCSKAHSRFDRLKLPQAIQNVLDKDYLMPTDIQ